MLPYNVLLNRESNILKKESYKIKDYHKENKEFNRYFRTSNDSFDRIYFTRNKNNIKHNLDSFVFERDPKFTTSHDFKLATIIANDATLNYLEDKIIKLENIGKNNFSKDIIPTSSIKWTGMNTEFTELVYALYFSETFNNGKTEIKEITNLLEHGMQ